MAYASWADHVYRARRTGRRSTARPTAPSRRCSIPPPARSTATTAGSPSGSGPGRARCAARTPRRAWSPSGRGREWLTRRARDDGYGAGSPFARLVEADGQVLMLGAPLETVTLLHHAEAIAARARQAARSPSRSRLADGTTQSFTDIDTSRGAYAYELLGLEADEFEVIARDALAAGVGRARAGRRRGVPPVPGARADRVRGGVDRGAASADERQLRWVGRWRCRRHTRSRGPRWSCGRSCTHAVQNVTSIRAASAERDDSAPPVPPSMRS